MTCEMEGCDRESLVSMVTPTGTVKLCQKHYQLVVAGLFRLRPRPAQAPERSDRRSDR